MDVNHDVDADDTDKKMSVCAIAVMPTEGSVAAHRAH